MNLTITPVKIQNNLKLNLSTAKRKSNFAPQATGFDTFVKTQSIQNSQKNISFKGGMSNEEYEELEKNDSIEWAKRWDYNERKSHYDTKYENEISGKLTSIGNKKIRAKWNALFASEQTKVTNILQTLSNVQEKVDKAASTMEAAEKQALINATTNKLLQQTQRIKDRISSRIDNQNNNLDKTIAGYDFQKDIIRDNFLYPILIEKEYIEEYKNMLENKETYTKEEIDDAHEKAYSQPVAPGLLLYGCFGTGKTAFAHAAASEADCYLVEFQGGESFAFDKFIDDVQKNARERYLTTGQRTVAVINEADSWINNSSAFDEPLDSEEEKEFKIIDRRVSKMRNILEHCYKLPEEDGTGGSALTFMFTTNHPQKMTDIGLLEKKQRINAVISVEPATGEDLKEVLKFHIKRVMPEESSFDLDNYDFTPIMEKLDISEKKGCYHNGQISGVADEIRTAYDNDPSKSFKEHFENMVLNDKAPSLAKRGLSPKVCNKYYNDLVEVGGYINDKSNKVSEEEGEI